MSPVFPAGHIILVRMVNRLTATEETNTLIGLTKQSALALEANNKLLAKTPTILVLGLIVRTPIESVSLDINVDSIFVD
jgi:hypothetical protein